jgi:hypothetical protein
MDRNTNFDSLINSSQNLVPQRLSFNFLNNTESNNSISSNNNHKKRKCDEMEKDNFNESVNSSTSSISSTFNSLEMKLLRSDLIEAQSRVNKAAANCSIIQY